MPIYEYRCSACGHELEALQKFSDAPLADCPSCHAATLVKLLSAAGFQLKGSGWYATDFKGTGGKLAPAKTDAASQSAAAGDGGAKGDSKTESTVGAKTESGSETASSTPAPAAKTGASPATT